LEYIRLLVETNVYYPQSGTSTLIRPSLFAKDTGFKREFDQAFGYLFQQYKNNNYLHAVSQQYEQRISRDDRREMFILFVQSAIDFHTGQFNIWHHRALSNQNMENNNGLHQNSYKLNNIPIIEDSKIQEILQAQNESVKVCDEFGQTVVIVGKHNIERVIQQIYDKNVVLKNSFLCLYNVIKNNNIISPNTLNEIIFNKYPQDSNIENKIDHLNSSNVNN